MKKKFFSRTTFISLLFSVCCLAVLLPQSCTKEKDPTEIIGSAKEPSLPATPYQYDNGQDNLATLGRVLFYDKNLSLNNQIACGTCHKQQFAFAENKQFSQGLFNGYTSRNSSSLMSSAVSVFGVDRNRFWDGRAGNTDTAVFMPVMNNLEMHMFDLNLLPSKLNKVSYYPALFTNAYGSSEITVDRIRSALSCFVNNLNSHTSPYDEGNLTAIQHEGKDLFEDKARCYNCHNGTDFNGYQTSFQNIGLEVNYSDIGRGRVTMDEHDNGKFNVPTLRNVEYSAPYMHDGRYATLREVIDHYDHGVQDSRNLSFALRDIPETAFDSLTEYSDFSSFPVVQLGLTEHEKQALESFLKSLSDPAFISDPRYSDPFR